MKKAIIHLYTICWNEEKMLEFFFRYYDPIVDQYFFYDDGSDDQTLEILNNHPKVEVRSLPRRKEDSYVLAAKDLHDACWKESRGQADWVIYTAIDEFLYHPQLMEYIQACGAKGITAIPALGYQMLSDFFPEKGSHILEKVKDGAPYHMMNKLSLFKPDAIEETHFTAGRHTANPTGNIVYPEKDVLLNLHCKYLSFSHTFERHKELHIKLGTFDKQKKWGHKYAWGEDKLKEEWNYFSDQLVHNVIDKIEAAHDQHSATYARWWRAEEMKDIFQKIFVQIKNEKYKEAINGLQLIVETDGVVRQEKRKAFMHLIRCYRFTNKLHLAEKYVGKGLKLFPQYTFLLFQHADLMRVNKKWELALKRYERLLSIEPQHKIGLMHKGNCLFNLDKIEEAEVSYLEIIKQHPDFKPAYIAYARAADKKQNWKEAVVRWQTVLNAFADSPNAYLRIAIAHSKLNQLLKAKEILQEGIKCFPNHEVLQNALKEIS